MHNQNSSRRQFIRNIFLMGLVIPFFGRLGKTFAAEAKKEPLPAGTQPVAENDPVATALGYKANVKDLDYKKYPQRKKPEAKNQFCQNCAFFTALNKDWGKCQLIQAGAVSSKGWCGSYQKKA